MKFFQIYLVIVLSFFCVAGDLRAESSIDGIKGIWSSIKNFPLFTASFWKGIGAGFGAPPTGYVYSYMVHNDTDQSVWVATQDLASVMGGVFPVASGWNCTQIPAHTAHGEDYKEYYFELFIKTSSKSYSNHMPYLQHSDVLFQTEKIDLIPSDKSSEHRNHFRVYMGKDFSNGSYKHLLKAEPIGYENIVANPKDKNAITIGSQLSSLTIKNSTNQDYYIGFATGAASTITSVSSCQMVGLLEKNSFGLLSAAGSIRTLRPGVIGVFANRASAPILVMPIQAIGFNGYPYTLEIYQDQGQEAITCQWQGIISGNYDMPVNRVKDITPIIGSFWYQSVAQAQMQSGIDLPGTVWIVSLEKNSKSGKILGMAQPGQVILFDIQRPNIGDKKEIYFIYVNSTDHIKAQAFVNNFLAGKIGVETVTAYQQNLSSVMTNTELQLNFSSVLKGAPTTVPQAVISESLINQIAASSFDISRGQIVDTSLGITGFLLGHDLFLPVGIGAGPFYYVLAPSYTANQQVPLPVSAVQNQLTSAPQSLPSVITPNTYAPTTYSIS